MFGLFRPIPHWDWERGKDHDGAFVRVMARRGHSDHEENLKLENQKQKTSLFITKTVSSASIFRKNIRVKSIIV